MGNLRRLYSFALPDESFSQNSMIAGESRLESTHFIEQLLDSSTRDGANPRITLGGQVAPLLDYLQIRPSRWDAVQRLAEADHLQIGPWFVLPNTLLVSGISLIHNLLHGMQFAEDAGSRVDDLPIRDPFTLHQLPQVLRGLGIDTVTVIDGVGSEASIWASPDGSEVSTISASGHAGSAVYYVQSPIGVWVEAAQGSESSDELSEYGSSSLRAAASTRVAIKQRNHYSESLLSQWSAPFFAWATLLSDALPFKPELVQSHLDHARTLLLRNQSEAILAGACSDSVAAEAMVRFDQVEQSAESILQSSFRVLAQHVDDPEVDALSRILVFNGAGVAQSDVMTVALEPEEVEGPLAILTDSGEMIGGEIESAGSAESEHYLRFAVEDVPSLGYRTFWLIRESGTVEPVAEDDAQTIENDRYRVTLEANTGSLTLDDKITGRSYHDFNKYVSATDTGDATRSVTLSQSVVALPANAPIQAVRQTGPVQQSLQYLQIYRVPEASRLDGTARPALAHEFVPLSIWTTVRIYEEIDRIDILASVSNIAADRLLSASFNLGRQIEGFRVDRPFEIETIWLDDLLNASERDSLVLPQGAFVDAFDGDHGLIVGNRGIPAYELQQQDNGDTTLSLPLLRSVGSLQVDIDGEAGQHIDIPGAQGAGEFTFSYCLIPYAETPLHAWQTAWGFQTGLRGVAGERGDGSMPTRGSLLASDTAEFKIDSVERAAEGGLLIRGYNLTDKRVTVDLSTDADLQTIRRTEIDGSPRSASKALDDGTTRVRVNGHEIATFYLR